MTSLTSALQCTMVAMYTKLLPFVQPATEEPLRQETIAGVEVSDVGGGGGGGGE